MAIPTLTPVSTTSAITLPSTGTPSLVAASCPIGVYTASTDFLSGAADQVAYTYQKLGGDILDIELTTGSVYAAYEEAVLEYSYIVNMHQSKNILSDVLGMTTGTFDHDGESLTGDTNVALKYPKTTFAYNQKMTEGSQGKQALEQHITSTPHHLQQSRDSKNMTCIPSSHLYLTLIPTQHQETQFHSQE